MSDLHIELRGEAVTLLAERALFRERNATLYVADLHLGKAATFRAERIAIPPGTTAVTLERLSDALQRTEARRLVVLGDFFHARAGRHADTTAKVQQWRAARPDLPMVLVRGNHDRHAGDPDVDLRIDCHDAPLADSGWWLHHHPGPPSHEFWLAGHVHPAASLVGLARQSLFLPCFHATAHGVVLPSFGEFTGKAEVRVAGGDRVFVIAGDEVLEVD